MLAVLPGFFLGLGDGAALRSTLTLQRLGLLATSGGRRCDNTCSALIRKTRPVELVCTHPLSSLRKVCVRPCLVVIYITHSVFFMIMFQTFLYLLCQFPEPYNLHSHICRKPIARGETCLLQSLTALYRGSCILGI